MSFVPSNPPQADIINDLAVQAKTLHEYGSYTAHDFQHVANAYLTLARQLNVEDHGLLGPITNANIVRLIHHPKHGYGVLKVSIIPTYHEGPLLSLYTQKNLPVPTVHDHGTVTQPPLEHTLPWIWTSHIEGTEPDQPIDATWITRGTALAHDLRLPINDTSLLPELTSLPHMHKELLTRINRYESDIKRMLHNYQHATGHNPFPAWGAIHHNLAVNPMYITRTHILHGDLHSRNTLYHHATDTLYAIAPTGKLGTPEHELATWIAIAAAQTLTQPTSAIQTALHTDTTLVGRELTKLTLAHMVLLAESEHRNNFLNHDPNDVLRIALTTPHHQPLHINRRKH